jgi:predicted HTH transcriptional regulator
MGMEEFRRDFPEETNYLEFKQGVSRNQIQDTVVAFSNAGGGVILIGVADDGTVVGRQFDAGTVDSIHQVMRDVHDPGRYSLHDSKSMAGPWWSCPSLAARRDSASLRAGW